MAGVVREDIVPVVKAADTRLSPTARAREETDVAVGAHRACLLPGWGAIHLRADRPTGQTSLHLRPRCLASVLHVRRGTRLLPCSGKQTHEGAVAKLRELVE